MKDGGMFTEQYYWKGGKFSIKQNYLAALESCEQNGLF